MIQNNKKSFIVHKPINVLCSNNSNNTTDHTRDTLYDIVKNANFPINYGLVGRLDADTSGIIMFTTDGNLNNHILQPIELYESNNNTEHSILLNHLKLKEYILCIYPIAKEIYYNEYETFNYKTFEEQFGKSFKFLRKGIEYYVQKPLKIKVLKRYIHKVPKKNKECYYTELLITINEGKHKQLRRLAKLNGYHVYSLQRISLCNGLLSIDSIPKPGDCRWLTSEEEVELDRLISFI